VPRALFLRFLVTAKYSEISPYQTFLIELTEIKKNLISRCSIHIYVRLIRVKIMSQYWKLKDLKEKMLEIQEEVRFHEHRLYELKPQSRAELMNR